jgi:ABC-type glycerol-3-phosphate transport system permease component
MNQKQQKQRRSPLARIGIYGAAIVVGFFAVAPFAWMLLTSIKPDSQIQTRTPVFWPSHPTLSRYGDVLDAGFATALKNSLIVSVGATVAGVVVAAMAGYALARFDLPLKKYLLLLVMGVQMFPVAVLLIPLFVVMKDLHLLESWLGVEAGRILPRVDGRRLALVK